MNDDLTVRIPRSELTYPKEPTELRSVEVVEWCKQTLGYNPPIRYDDTLKRYDAVFDTPEDKLVFIMKWSETIYERERKTGEILKRIRLDASIPPLIRLPIIKQMSGNNDDK